MTRSATEWARLADEATRRSQRRRAREQAKTRSWRDFLGIAGLAVLGWALAVVVWAVA